MAKFMALSLTISKSFKNQPTKCGALAALRCGNLRSFTLSKLPQVILARLVLLAFSYGYKCGAILRCGYYKTQKKGGRYGFTAP